MASGIAGVTAVSMSRIQNAPHTEPAPSVTSIFASFRRRRREDTNSRTPVQRRNTTPATSKKGKKGNASTSQGRLVPLGTALGVCASTASGAARRPPAVATRNARRFITCPHWPRLGGNGVGAASGSPITRSFPAPPLALCAEGTARVRQRLGSRLGDLRILLGGGAG